MCGLLGYASAGASYQHRWLDAGGDLLVHRGPDSSGLWTSDDGCVGLAHRRLAILDLSPSGHQPMRDEAHGLTIVFNGEIFNHAALRAELCVQGATFRSGSDTEVLLQAYRVWGEACLDRFDGMFAFAIHDAKRGIVLLARDRAGEKPLFYYAEPGGIRFASELKALLIDPALPRRIDRGAADCYLAMGYAPGSRCMLHGFAKVPPASALTFNLASGMTRIWRYWLPPVLTVGAGESADDDALVDRLDDLLEASVRDRLVADVPVGVLLSGGTDSSLITAMAARGGSTVRTFTVRFPGHAAQDETAHARLIANHFSTEHTELDASVLNPGLLSVLAEQYDEPIIDSSMIPTTLLCCLVRERCTVALGGDGGDELFGGYRHHSRLLHLRQLVGRVPLALRRAAAGIIDALLPAGAGGRAWIAAAGSDWARELPQVACYFPRRLRRRLLSAHAGWPMVAEQVWRERVPADADLLQRATRMDFQDYLAEDILVKTDRASMLHSLELRAPFLSVPLIEFAFSQVPTRLKATSSARKIILRRLATRVLPIGFDSARKQGFCLPLGAWLEHGLWRRFFQDILTDPGCSFDRRVVDALLARPRAANASERLFGLVLFELWRVRYRLSF